MPQILWRTICHLDHLSHSHCLDVSKGSSQEPMLQILQNPPNLASTKRLYCTANMPGMRCPCQAPVYTMTRSIESAFMFVDSNA